MKLNLEKPLLFFDIESTGLNIASDAIIELSFVKVYPDETEEIKTWKIKPWDYLNNKQIPISPSASAVNGVVDEDLKDCPKFINVITEVADMLRGCDLSGFNSTKFDLPMLAEEFERVKAYCEMRINDKRTPEENKKKAQEMLSKIDLDFHKCRMVDVQTIFHYMEPRNLKAAYRFYCGGEDFDNAHTAEADTIATYKVLKGQLDMYSKPDGYHDVVLKNDVKFLSELASRGKTLDYAGRIILKDGVPTISFGKHRDKPVKEVFETERNYFSWIYNGEFTLDTKRQFKMLEEQFKKEAEEAKKQPASEEQLQQLLNLNTNKR